MDNQIDGVSSQPNEHPIHESMMYKKIASLNNIH